MDDIGFVQGLSEKKLTRDGQPAKRRGPKPDSRPALTRRQELNRQAQRTHRERKELYIKALEDEVLRLKEVYSNVAQDKERLADENRQLRQMLAQTPSSILGGTLTPGLVDDTTSNPSVGYAGSASGSYVAAPSSQSSNLTPPPMSVTSHRGTTSPLGAIQQPYAHIHSGHASVSPTPRQDPGIDYEQAGIDFVLTLEKPCMAHIPLLLERSAESGGEPCGHALMASCPPEPLQNITRDIPFGTTNIPDSSTGSDQATWELNKGELATLLHLSSKLNLDGEITPVMAWGIILAHPRLGELTLLDFQKLTDDLKTKIRCYGFGAVLEEFEIRDALENIFSVKPDPYSPNPNLGFAVAF